MKRLVAIVGAAAMIVVAFVARDAIGGDEDGGGGSTSDPPDSVAAPPEVPAGTVVCIDELADICAAVEAAHPDLDVVVEAAGATLDRLAALEDPADAPLWLTVDPYPAMVDASRGTRQPIGFGAEALAASPLAVAVAAGGRAGALATGCADVALWPCLGDHAGEPWSNLGGEAAWGTVRPSLGDVADSALGLASFASAVAGYTGTASFDEADWSGEIPGLRSLAQASSRAPNSGGTPLATMATGRAVDVAATSDADLAGLGATSGRYALVYPDQSMWLPAVLAVPAGVSAPDGLAATAADALATAGWQPPDDATDVLPPAPVMIELRQLWTELT